MNDRRAASCLVLASALALAAPARADEPLLLDPPATAPSAAPAPAEADPAWELRVYDDGAFAGDTLYYEVSWTNRGEAPVRVPVDLVARLVRKVEYAHGDLRMASVVALAPPADPPPPVAWVTVAPGQRVQRIGPLSEHFGVCQPGCPAGRYDLQLLQPARLWRDLAPDQREPMAGPLTWHRELGPPTSAEGLAPIMAGPGLEATLTVVGRHGRDVALRVRVTNRLGAPIWVPKPDRWAIECSGRTSFDYDVGTGWAEKSRVRGAQAWGPAEGRLLRPGQHLDLPLTRMLHGVDHVAGEWIQAKVRPSTGFAPGSARVEVPFWFAGTLETPEVRLR